MSNEGLDPLKRFIVKGIAGGIGLASESISSYQARRKASPKDASTPSKSASETESATLNDGCHPLEGGIPGNGISHTRDEESQWRLDETQDQLLPPRSLEKDQAVQLDEHLARLRVDDLNDSLARRYPPPLDIKSIPKLSMPVILPQRRPKSRQRGFIRAYAPILDSATISQDMFLDFLETFHKSSQASPWFAAINLAAMGLTFIPHLPMIVGFAHFSDNLSVALALRSQRMGVMENLDHAIVASTGAVRATPEDDPQLAIRLYNLSDRLKDRFKSTGVMEDLDRAVDAAKESVAITPPDNTYLPTFLSNYGDTLGLRFERTGALDDLQDAIENMTNAANASPQGGYIPGSYLNALGLLLGKQFEKTGAQDDIDHAIKVITKAVDMTPPDHPDRAIYMNNLGNQFGRRFEKTGSMEDLDRGVENVGWAMGTIPDDHPSCPSLFNNLGNWLGKRFERANAEIDLDQQFIAYFVGGRYT